MLLYYITDRTQFVGDEVSRRRALLAKIAEASRCGVDFIQLRERDLSARELENLAQDAVRTVRENSSQTQLLINSRADVAIACGADGVHLRSEDVLPGEVRAAWKQAIPVISLSCHSPADVDRAAAEGADLAVFAPVFEKQGSSAVGLGGLRTACEHPIKVLALGGVTRENARACVEAGAAGVAGIRLFQENDAERVVEALRRNG